jgi:hypothetical protein
MAKGVACLICMHASTIPVYTQARLGHAVIIAVVKDALAVRVVDLAVRVRRILEEWASFFKEWATFPSLAAEPVASLPWWPQQLGLYANEECPAGAQQNGEGELP